ncbi:MAG: GNAT family N-acetyltransferase [Candidatus Dormibacteria bacterium]
MQVRSASYRDLSQVDELYRASLAVEQEIDQRLQSAGPQSPVPGPALARAWSILTRSLSALMPLADVGDQLHVAESDGKIVGFIQAEPAPGKRAWRILNLGLAHTAEGHFAGVPLLQHLVNEGLERGVTRFLVRIPEDHPLQAMFREQGFQPFASEQILFRELPKPPDHHPEPWVPASSEDLAGVHLLYLRTAPHAVAAVEAPNATQWRATFQLGWLGRMDGRSGDSRHYVIRRNGGIVAWAGVRLPARARPSLIGMMLDPQESQLAVEALHSLLGQVPAGPTLCLLRHYDAELHRAVAARGFEPVATQILMARDLPLKLRARHLAEQKKAILAGAIPVVQARGTADPTP